MFENRKSICSNLSQLIFFVYFNRNESIHDSNRLICGNLLTLINVQGTTFYIKLFMTKIFFRKYSLFASEKPVISKVDYRPIG
jgi:hypothetical protein